MLNGETEFRNIVVTFSNKDNIDSIHEAVQNSCARQIYKIRDFKNMNDSGSYSLAVIFFLRFLVIEGQKT